MQWNCHILGARILIVVKKNCINDALKMHFFDASNKQCTLLKHGLSQYGATSPQSTLSASH